MFFSNPTLVLSNIYFGWILEVVTLKWWCFWSIFIQVLRNFKRYIYIYRYGYIPQGRHTTHVYYVASFRNTCKKRTSNTLWKHVHICIGLYTSIPGAIMLACLMLQYCLGGLGLCVWPIRLSIWYLMVDLSENTVALGWPYIWVYQVPTFGYDTIILQLVAKPD